MSTTMNPLMLELEDQAVIARAADAGFRLAQYETDQGHSVWEWRHGSDPRPQFVTRRVAVHWMAEFLERDAGLPFVARDGQAYEDRPRSAA
ncbi:MAG: hypothetical protein ABW033_12175 [Acidimicrobiia bacterium]